MVTTIHTIAKDEWEAGDYVTCDCCGAHLRHYAKIAGATYGLNCAKSKGLIGKKITAKKAKMIIWEIETFKNLYIQGKTDAAYGWARTIDIKLGFNFPNSQDYLTQIFEAVN